ncbi:tetratricopeptide repeat protein [Aquimarina sp. 2304DJ70-9]|uniref:tetratricopeptide repeat protein n=1 Tax=Aquimarina penaris TaxID=3231044 RepID=UPI00346312E6
MTLCILKKNSVTRPLQRGLVVFLCFLVCTVSLYSQSFQSHADSLQKLLQKPISDSLKLQYNMDLAHIYMDLDPSKMMGYADNALVLAEKLNSEQDKAFIYNYKGVYHCKKGEFQLGLQHFLSGLKIMEKTNHTRGQAEGLMNIGNLYLTIENYKESEKYLFRALEMSKLIKSENSIMMINNNLGILFSRRGDLDKALQHYDRALEKAKELSHKNQMISLYINTADIYLQKKDYKNGESYYGEAMKLSTEVGNFVAETQIKIALGQVYTFRGDFSQATKYLEEGLKQAITIEANDLASKAYYNLSEIYEQQGNFEKALKIKEKYSLTKDTLGRNIIKMTNVLSAYEVDKKEEEIIAKESELKKTTTQKKMITIIGVIVSLGLLFLGGFMYFRKQRLAREKKQVEWENNILGQTNVDLKKRLEMLSDQIKNKPEKVDDPEQKNKKYRTSTLSEEEREKYMQQILDFMETEKPYLDSELTLGKLAEELTMVPYHLSEVLNEALRKSFYDFINIYRVEAVKQFMADPKTSNLTLLGIAFDAGFNSKTAFNRAFKKATGLSPSKYRQKHIQEKLSKEV